MKSLEDWTKFSVTTIRICCDLSPSIICYLHLPHECVGNSCPVAAFASIRSHKVTIRCVNHISPSSQSQTAAKRFCLLTTSKTGIFEFPFLQANSVSFAKFEAISWKPTFAAFHNFLHSFLLSFFIVRESAQYSTADNHLVNSRGEARH